MCTHADFGQAMIHFYEVFGSIIAFSGVEEFPCDTQFLMRFLDKNGFGSTFGEAELLQALKALEEEYEFLALNCDFHSERPGWYLVKKLQRESFLNNSTNLFEANDLAIVKQLGETFKKEVGEY